MSGIVAVTGATGFIGHTLVTRLCNDGWRVRALTRQDKNSDTNIRWISGGLDDRDALHELIKDADAVIHCAGQVRGSSAEEFNRTNADGTENLIRVCVQHNPQTRFLLVSSLAARESQLSWYANSKYLGEQAVINNSGSMSCTIFRPTAVYGPGDEELSPLFKTARLGVLPAAGSSSGRFGLIHVDDLVSAIMAWLLVTDRSIQGLFELDDGCLDGYDYSQLAATVSQVWKHPVFVLPIPNILIQGFARINLYLARLFHYSPMLTPGKIRELQHPDWVCDNSPLSQAIGWKPEVKLIDALPKAILPASDA
jgi:nucleoside-diphosphate-sugar epimerase